MMYKIFFLSLLLCIWETTVLQAQDFQKLHKDMVVVDGHNDVIISSILKGRDIGKALTMGHTDIPRLQKGGVDVQVFAVWSNDQKWKKNAFKHANEQIDSLESVIQRNSAHIQLAKSTQQINDILKQGKIVA
ncbi:MAG TPA: membrane dipeptidase, partial [Sphingobacterium sp.]|nr:membrane dipeptidase [Sphingobacterium sp.]